MLCGSDIPALLAHTRDMIFLEDGEIAELKQGGARASRRVDGEPVERKSKRIDWSAVQAEKGGYKHFMLKEIHEQPARSRPRCAAGSISQNGDVHAAEIGVTPEFAKQHRARLLRRLRHEPPRRDGRPLLDRAARARARRRSSSRARCATASPSSSRTISSSP